MCPSQSSRISSRGPSKAKARAKRLASNSHTVSVSNGCLHPAVAIWVGSYALVRLMRGIASLGFRDGCLNVLTLIRGGWEIVGRFTGLALERCLSVAFFAWEAHWGSVICFGRRYGLVIRSIASPSAGSEQMGLHNGMGWEWRCLWSPRMRSLGRLMAAGRSFLSVFAHLSIRTKVLFSDDTKNHNILVIYFTYSRPRHALCPLFLKATITPCRSKMLDLPRSISDDTLQESLRTVSSIHHVSYYTTTHQLLNFHSTLTVAFAACPV
jgi:hypothetical protein